MTFTLRTATQEDKATDFTFYGHNRDYVRYKGLEAMVHGPAETGKSLSLLWKCYLCACKYPGASIVLMRKTLSSAHASIIPMFEQKVLSDDSPCTPYGGATPRWYDFNNGARIWVAGMDKSSKILSAEHDLIAFFQADEAELDDWETCTTRTTGRAGHMPYAQTLGDMNPTYPLDWPYHRPSLKMFHSRHVDNPTLYDPETGKLTAQGKITMRVLGNLTGTRRARLLDGRPSVAEGSIYQDYDEQYNLVYKRSVPKLFRYVAGIDWGYRNPGVLGVWGIDGRNSDMYLVAQYYRRNETDDWWLCKAKELYVEFSRRVVTRGGIKREFMIEAFICDPSEPAYIEKFRRAGLPAKPGFNGVRPGIDAMSQRVKHATDKSGPAMYIVRDNLREVDESLKADHKPYRLEDEFPSYIWASTEKEQPVKKDDHGMDMSRYVVCYIDDIGQDEVQEAGTW